MVAPTEARTAGPGHRLGACPQGAGRPHRGTAPNTGRNGQRPAGNRAAPHRRAQEVRRPGCQLRPGAGRCRRAGPGLPLDLVVLRTVGRTFAWLVGYWPLQAQQEVFGENPDTLLSSSLNTGKATCEPVEGGYCLSGRWEFSSGCDHAGWVMLGIPGIGRRAWALIPRNDFVIVDTWFVSGASRQRQQGHHC